MIKTIVKVVAPEIGQTIYDGAVGSARFLCEAFEYLKHSKTLTTTDVITLQKQTFYGKEKKSLAYIIGTMNMILHGVEAPNIVHTNTLTENIADLQEKDRYDIVLANPPFGGKERTEVQQNFPIKTGETASLFLQHFIKILKAGGKAGVVIKNTFLSNTDNASISLRKLLLESSNLHTVLDLPGGTFNRAGVKTVVLFFEKGQATEKVWFYQLNLDRNLGKTNALNEKDLAEFVELQKTQAESENSWNIQVKDIDQTTFDLSAKNPNKKTEAPLRQPEDILAAMENDMATLSQLEKEGIIQRFEYTFELAWKVLKDKMENDGIILDQISPKAVIRQAFAAKYINNPDTWLKMIGDRYLMNHTYDFIKFEAVIQSIAADYLPMLEEWHLQLLTEIMYAWVLQV